MARQRKTRSDAVLLNLPPERQEQIIEWCDTPKSETCIGGYQFARAQLAADGLKVSLRAVSDFWSEWYLQQDLNLADRVEETVKAVRPGEAKLAREAGEAMLLKLSLARQDPKLFSAAAVSIDMRRNLDLQEESGKTKAEIARIKIEQKNRDHALALKKFQRDSCKLFLQWFDKETAKQIATSGASNAEKIEQLGLAMFGEDWAS